MYLEDQCLEVDQLNMNGIMSGIKDRQNYQYGERVKEEYEGIKPVVEEVMGTYKKPSGFEDPVSINLQYKLV
jgi:hypothetical protein